MVTIIHGDDTALSRNYFLELKQKQNNITLFDASKLTLTDLIQETEGSSLFGTGKKIYIENLLSKGKKIEKSIKDIISHIAKTSENTDYILWEPKELTKSSLNTFKNSSIKAFKLPKTIFTFLDNLRPNNSVLLLKLFHENLRSGVSEDLILYMIQRQFRILLAISDSGQDSIEEVKRLAPWQTGKIENQARIFGTDKLKSIYKKLFEIELGQKTGSLPLSLAQTIDFLLLEM